jgi:hypothetical protein
MAIAVMVTATGRITDRRAARRSNQGKSLVVTPGIAGTFVPTQGRPLSDMTQSPSLSNDQGGVYGWTKRIVGRGVRSGALGVQPCCLAVRGIYP